MARGRLLNKSVCMSLKFHRLPDDTCRLLATWLISQLDLNGVFYGDPAMVKSLVFPRRADVTVEQVEGYLAAMVQIGLIVRFEARGELWMWWPGFDENQPNLRKERELSDFPLPPADDCGQDDGVMTADCRQDDGAMTAECRNDAGMSPAEEEVNISLRIREREEKDKGKGKGIAAPRSGDPMPPAVVVIAEVTKKRPEKVLWCEIDDTVGRDPPDLEFLREVVVGWLSCGWNPGNVAGILDWFERGEVPPQRCGAQKTGAADYRTDSAAYLQSVDGLRVLH